MSGRLFPVPRVLCFLLASLALAAPRETGFLNRRIEVHGDTFRYQVYVPAEWSKARKWPLILFLHGAGERGDDGLAQTQVGIGAAIRFHASRFPAVVVMPQCRKGVWRTDPRMEAQVLAILARSLKEFRADPARVYLTGLSMGGYGTLALGAKHPGRFAALGAVCGGVVRPRETPQGDPYGDAARKIGKTPVWLFHGDADSVVPVTESRKMNGALKAAGGDVRYTEYPGVNHNSWDKAYADPDFIAWLLAQRLGSR